MREEIVVKPPAICLVSFSFHPSIGGVPRKARFLVEGLLARKHRVTVATRKTDSAAQALRPDVRLVRLSCFPWVRGLRKFGEWHFLFSVLFFLVRYRREFDIFHNFTGFSEAFATVLAAKLTKKKVVVSLEGSGLSSELRHLEEKKVFGKFLARFICRKADCLVAVNDAMLLELGERGVEESRRVKIPNAVPVPKALPAPGERKRLRSKYRIEQDIVALYTGRIDSMKDLRTLIRAWVKVSGLRSDVLLLVVGDGDQRPILEREAKTLGLSGRVRFLGERNDVHEYLSLSDIFVLPSLAEGLSVSLLEAMSYGLAVVVSDIPANREVIVDGVHGLVSPTGDVGQLAQAILKLVDNPSLREDLGMSAARKVRDGFVLEDMIDRYQDLYSRLLLSPA